MASRFLLLTALASVVALQSTIAFSAGQSVTSTSIGRFATEAFELPFQEQADLCSAQHPELKSAFTMAITELRKRYVSLLVQALETEQFATLLEAEVPQSLFLLNRQQSAMRRQVNTTIAQEACDKALGGYPDISDQLLSETIRILLRSMKSIIDASRAQGAK